MIQFPDTIFKAYDVRGIYGRDFDDEFAYLFGRGIVRYLKCKKGVSYFLKGVTLLTSAWYPPMAFISW